MFNHDDDRTLPPTERHRREARARGEVARSAELTSAIVLLAASVVFWWLAPAWVTEFIALIRGAIATSPSPSIPKIEDVAQRMGQAFATILLPAASVLVMSALAASMTQTGWIFIPSKIIPRFRPSGLLSWDRVVGTVGRILQLIVLAIVTWAFVSTRRWQFVTLGLGEPSAQLVQGARLLGELIVQLSVCLVFLALIDYGFRFWRHERGLKMTAEERRREQRDDDGDPRMKQQRVATSRHFRSMPPQIEPVASTPGGIP